MCGITFSSRGRKRSPRSRGRGCRRGSQAARRRPRPAAYWSRDLGCAHLSRFPHLSPGLIVVRVERVDAWRGLREHVARDERFCNC